MPSFLFPTVSRGIQRLTGKLPTNHVASMRLFAFDLIAFKGLKRAPATSAFKTGT